MGESVTSDTTGAYALLSVVTEDDGLFFFPRPGPYFSVYCYVCLLILGISG